MTRQFMNESVHIESHYVDAGAVHRAIDIARMIFTDLPHLWDGMTRITICDPYRVHHAIAFYRFPLDHLMFIERPDGIAVSLPPDYAF